MTPLPATLRETLSSDPRLGQSHRADMLADLDRLESAAECIGLIAEATRSPRYLLEIWKDSDGVKVHWNKQAGDFHSATYPTLLESLRKAVRDG